MKNKILIFIILIGLFTIANFPVRAADQGYTPLEPLPAVGPSPGYSGGGLSGYLQWLFTFAISIAGILAVLMIVVGGIQYMTAYGNPGQVGNAKNRIHQALLGLLLAISAWLILYTINPDLIKGQLNIPAIPSGLKTLQPWEALKLEKSSQPQQDPCKGFICNTISKSACAKQGGTILIPCETFCKGTKGLCGGTFVCCKR